MIALSYLGGFLLHQEAALSKNDPDPAELAGHRCSMPSTFRLDLDRSLRENRGTPATVWPQQPA
jgi:hypothetical protein